MRKQFTITIWHWKKKLHQGTYEFDDLIEASWYEQGLYDGMRIAGKQPTGSSLKPVIQQK